MTRAKPNSNRVAAGVAIFIALLFVGGLAWAFGRQLICARQVWAEEARLEREVAAAQARHDALVEQLEYVRSDAYVEQWARKEAKMIRPGEVLVIVAGEEGGESPAQSPRVAAPAAQPRPFWVEWWEWLIRPWN